MSASVQDGYVIRRRAVHGVGYFYLTPSGGWSGNVDLAREFKNVGDARVVLRRRIAEIIPKRFCATAVARGGQAPGVSRPAAVGGPGASSRKAA
jgi:hypothetical protein